MRWKCSGPFKIQCKWLSSSDVLIGVSKSLFSVNVSYLSKHLYNVHVIEDCTCFVTWHQRILNIIYFIVYTSHSYKYNFYRELPDVVTVEFVETLFEIDLLSGFMFGFEGMDMHVNGTVPAGKLCWINNAST